MYDVYFLYWCECVDDSTIVHNFISENEYEINTVVADEDGTMWRITDSAMEVKKIINNEEVYWWG